MNMGMMGGGSTEFTYKSLIFAMAILVLLPTAIAIYVPSADTDLEEEVLDGYYQMTGQTASTKVSVWPLTGIYTPYTGGAYGYTEDGWLYGAEMKSYTPTQYGQGTPEYFVSYKDDSGVFRYYIDSADYNEEKGQGHHGKYHMVTESEAGTGDYANNSAGDLVDNDYDGDLYTAVNFDVSHMSSIFFLESTKTETDDGHFFYQYDGYRFSFQPISNYTAVDADGNSKPIVATTTSLSLIWYQYYTQSGISGQLVLSGSNGGLAYLNAAQILSEFNSTTYTASFDLVFNGITMTVIIKIDPYYATSGYTIEDCYNNGWWSIMVTSLSADSSAYTGTDFAADPMKILDTIMDLFTFNYSDYDMSSWMGVICSMTISIPLYACLIAILADNAYLWVIVGILAAVQAMTSIWPF